MADWLFELFSEEIPARMQAGAARDLERLAREGLTAAGLSVETLDTFSGLRRIALHATGLATEQAARSEERRGPRVAAPDAALAGFLRSTGLAREALVERDGFWIASLSQPGRRTAEVLAELAPSIIRRFPWPKSMTWGAGALRWVRPLHRILCLFDGEVVPFEVEGLQSGDLTEGHRVMGSGKPLPVRDFDSYHQALEQNFVVLDAKARSARIVERASALAEARSLALIDDPGLLAEVTGMVEWPVALMGKFDAAFLDLPPEVIRTSMRAHQRYFAVRDASGSLAPHFIAIANLETPDGGALIAKGNARVLAARLSDARFFWDEDRKLALEDRLPRLKGVTFHAKLGSMRARADRLERLSAAIAPLVGADPALAALAGRLAKADLVSGLVGEFPELQGVMGGYYARHEGQPEAVSRAIAEHYRPQGPSDSVPTEPVAIAVALAEKLDLIVGFFGIGEKPTGSRDPFALRRAALGVLRILSENGLRLKLSDLVALAAEVGGQSGQGVVDFALERLKVSLRDGGARPDVIEATFALADDDPARIAARLAALTAFLQTDDGANLLAGARRAFNILAAEAKKGPLPAAPPVRTGGPEEIALFDAVDGLRAEVARRLEAEDFTGAFLALAALRQPVDRFFEVVLVNSDDAAERANRLALLQRVRDAMGMAADFTLIQG